MGSEGADTQRAHERVMASLTSLHVPRRESMHAVVLEADRAYRVGELPESEFVAAVATFVLEVELLCQSCACACCLVRMV